MTLMTRSTVEPDSFASSSVVGRRPYRAVSAFSTSSIRRAAERSDRGAQSLARTASRTAPRIRRETNLSNGTPRAGSNLHAASTTPSAPARMSSARSTCRGKCPAIEATTLGTTSRPFSTNAATSGSIDCLFIRLPLRAFARSRTQRSAKPPLSPPTPATG